MPTHLISFYQIHAITITLQYLIAILQFPPVRGRPLWKDPRPLSDDNVTGQQIWRRFENVVILDEQMRQSDPSFCELL